MNTAVTALLTALVTAGFTWLLGRSKAKADIRKTKAEAYSLEIKNAEAMVNFWKEMTNDLRKEISELTVKLEEALANNDALRKEMSLMKQEMARWKSNSINQK